MAMTIRYDTPAEVNITTATIDSENEFINANLEHILNDALVVLKRSNKNNKIDEFLALDTDEAEVEEVETDDTIRRRKLTRLNQVVNEIRDDAENDIKTEENADDISYMKYSRISPQDRDKIWARRGELIKTLYKHIMVVLNLLRVRYGKSNKHTKKMEKCYKEFELLRQYLDDVVTADYPYTKTHIIYVKLYMIEIMKK